MPLAYRIACRDDLPRIVEIYNATIASRLVTADLDPVSVESRHAWFDAHTPDFRPLWVTETNGEIAGWLSFSSFYGRPAYNGTAEISVYIDSRHRRSGLGRQLLELAIQQAPAIGVHTLLGFIFGQNAPSLALFSRYGFEQWARLPRVATLDGVDCDLLILGKRLSG